MKKIKEQEIIIYIANEKIRNCPICSTETNITKDNQAIYLSCLHYYCKECWLAYLKVKINEGQV